MCPGNLERPKAPPACPRPPLIPGISKLPVLTSVLDCRSTSPYRFGKVIMPYGFKRPVSTCVLELLLALREDTTHSDAELVRQSSKERRGTSHKEPVPVMKEAAPVMISLFSQNDGSGIIPPHMFSFSKSSPKCLPGASSQGTLLGSFSARSSRKIERCRGSLTHVGGGNWLTRLGWGRLLARLSWLTDARRTTMLR